jgi:hypothetical protein
MTSLPYWWWRIMNTRRPRTKEALKAATVGLLVSLGFGVFAVSHGGDAPGGYVAERLGDEVAGFEVGEGVVSGFFIFGAVEMLHVEFDGRSAFLVDAEAAVGVVVDDAAELTALAEFGFYTARCKVEITRDWPTLSGSLKKRTQLV